MDDTLIQSFQKSVNVGKSSDVKRKLIGCYSWVQKGKICIPGYPPRLHRNYINRRVGELQDIPMTKEQINANEHLHNIFFEPVEHLLKEKNLPLDDGSFHLLTDRNNIRKICAALKEDEKFYRDFEVLARKFGNLLVLKRVDQENIGSNGIGKQFESALTEPSDFLSCHALVNITYTNPDGKSISALVRCEVDACTPQSSTLSLKNYKEAPDTNNSNSDSNNDNNSHLSVMVPKTSCTEVPLNNLREMTMTGKLQHHHLLQSGIVGVPAIVHGVHRRSETPIRYDSEMNQEVSIAIDMLLSCGDIMEPKHTYRLSRKDGGKLEIEEVKDDKKWFVNLDWKE